MEWRKYICIEIILKYTVRVKPTQGTMEPAPKVLFPLAPFGNPMGSKNGCTAAGMVHFLTDDLRVTPKTPTAKIVSWNPWNFGLGDLETLRGVTSGNGGWWTQNLKSSRKVQEKEDIRVHFHAPPPQSHSSPRFLKLSRSRLGHPCFGGSPHDHLCQQGHASHGALPFCYSNFPQNGGCMEIDPKV